MALQVTQPPRVTIDDFLGGNMAITVNYQLIATEFPGRKFAHRKVTIDASGMDGTTTLADIRTAIQAAITTSEGL